MTREEAMINVLVKENDDLKSEINKLISTQEPCEDCISRQAVLDIAKSSKSNWIDNSVLFKRVNELSLVIPQPKTGKWILTIEDWNKWTCSECGYTKRTDIHIRLGYNYCPNCGAKMSEPRESEETDADSN